MKLPELRIGNFVPKFPIIQGGMAVRVSTSSLAGAVAAAGGIGVIAATGMALDELRTEIRQARKLANGGILGVNIMYAAKEFADLVHTAIEEGIDIIFTGAGFSRDIYRWAKDSKTAIVPIVSSAKAARIAVKYGAAAVVAEGTEAGGHLGTERPTRELLPEIVQAVDVPVVAAGGIVNGQDIADMVKLGASGVQMATRFVLSEECTVADAFKQLYLNATEEDVVLIKSPVGLPGRAINNKLAQQMAQEEYPKIKECEKCLKDCSKAYCIMKALNNAQTGNVDEGVVFSGQNVYKIKEILPVKVIFERLLEEYAAVK